MPTKEFYLDQIEKELTIAREAQTAGNDGKARVCSRRAAGHAITWFLSKHNREGWGSNAMGQLLKLKDDASFPPEVRDAANRLTARISERFTYSSSRSPIADALTIVTYIRKVMGDGFD